MKSITVFTATYNRAYCLHILYESLCRQTSDDFLWLIVDDGSVDDTKALVQRWIDEAKIEIQYFYKENGGLHTGYNVAIANTQTELCVCIDSDDFMPDDAVEKILTHWSKFGSDAYAGIIGLDFYLNGKATAGNLPDVKSVHIIEMKIKYKYGGDTKMVHRTELLKPHVPMPTLKGEKNFNPSYIFLKVDEQYPLLVLNENLCFVDYQPDGMSNNIFNQYRNSPNSFAETRRLHMNRKNVPLWFIYKNAIHYISSCIFAKEKNWLSKSPKKALTILAIVPGILLNMYIRYKSNK